MHDFILALIGGALIGVAAVILMATQGAVMGASGIISRLLPTPSSGDGWRIYFLLGLLLSPAMVIFLSNSEISIQITDSAPLLIVAGVLVGVGTVFGNGCTSGHGVCGISRFSNRSVLATCIFMLAAIVTVAIMKMV